MTKLKVFTVLLMSVVFLSAQPDLISEGQVNALKILAERNGFTEQQMDQFLLQRYGKPMAELNKTEGIELIKLFQSPNPPKPADLAPSLATMPGTVVPPTLATILEVGMSKRFHLVDNNIIEGKIIKIEDGICQIETVDGLLFISKSDILDEVVKVSKKDGTRYSGPVINETPEDITIRSNYGDVCISKRDIRDFDRYHGGKLIPMTEDVRRFFRGEAQLISIMMDPTAFLLEEQTFYISGLSMGYGFSDNFMLTTKFGSGFSGDLNIYPKIRLFHRQTGSQETAATVGLSIHRAYPLTSLAAKYSHTILDSSGQAINEIKGINVSDDVLMDKKATNVYSELYVVISKRKSLESGRGKAGWTLGMKTSSFNQIKPELQSGYTWSNDAQFKIPFRIWMAFEYDLRKNLKFISKIWVDNSNRTRDVENVIRDYVGDDTPFVLDSPAGKYSLVDFDFGFLYALSENFRIGVHFQQPFLDFYWEFFEF